MSFRMNSSHQLTNQHPVSKPTNGKSSGLLPTEGLFSSNSNLGTSTTKAVPKKGGQAIRPTSSGRADYY